MTMDRRDTSAILIGAFVGTAVMLAVTLGQYGLTGAVSKIKYVAAISVLTAGVPAGITTGLLSEHGSLEIRHNGYAGVLAAAVGVLSIGVLGTASASAPTIAHKLDVLFVVGTYGFSVLVFLTLPLTFIVGGLAGRTVASIVDSALNRKETEWGESGKYKEYTETEDEGIRR